MSNSQNKELREQPQWVVDILNRLDKIEYRVKELEHDVGVLERKESGIYY